jgi:hypothetical protein
MTTTAAAVAQAVSTRRMSERQLCIGWCRTGPMRLFSPLIIVTALLIPQIAHHSLFPLANQHFTSELSNTENLNTLPTQRPELARNVPNRKKLRNRSYKALMSSSKLSHSQTSSRELVPCHRKLMTSLTSMTSMAPTQRPELARNVPNRKKLRNLSCKALMSTSKLSHSQTSFKEVTPCHRKFNASLTSMTSMALPTHLPRPGDQYVCSLTMENRAVNAHLTWPNSPPESPDPCNCHTHLWKCIPCFCS